MNTYEIIFDATKLDEYARGLISGILYMATGRPKETWRWSLSHNEERWYKMCECTAEQMEDAKKEIEYMFPGSILQVENATTE